MGNQKQERSPDQNIVDELAGVASPPLPAAHHTIDTSGHLVSNIKATTWATTLPRSGKLSGHLWDFLDGSLPVGMFQGEFLYINRKDPARGRWFIDLPNGQGTLILGQAQLSSVKDVQQLLSLVEHLLQKFRQASPPTPSREDTMFEQLLKLYTTYMISGVTSPMPHFVGPPGSGKSTVFKQLADMLGVNLHIVNVSRISPLGLEGLELPDSDRNALTLLISEMWTKAKEGDIYLFDEFLRGFPEVYNGLLDIFTGREVAGYQLPRVFIAGASNATATYDKALEDRLLHIPVPDPRKSKAEKRRLSQMLITELGLLPSMLDSYEMQSLMDEEVLPTFEILDHFNGKATRNGNTSIKGQSLRKLIGQAKMRHIQSNLLKDLINVNNASANRPGKHQYVLLMEGKHVPAGYESAARALRGNRKLTPAQQLNIELNLQLIEMQAALSEKETADADDDTTFA